MQFQRGIANEVLCFPILDRRRRPRHRRISTSPEKERETICPIVSRACLTWTFLTISSLPLESNPRFFPLQKVFLLLFNELPTESNWFTRRTKNERYVFFVVVVLSFARWIYNFIAYEDTSPFQAQNKFPPAEEEEEEELTNGMEVCYLWSLKDWLALRDKSEKFERDRIRSRYSLY